MDTSLLRFINHVIEGRALAPPQAGLARSPVHARKMLFWKHIAELTMRYQMVYSDVSDKK
jgi:hypothetical protein